MKINERSIFLVDAVGATLSAFCSGIFLPYFLQWTGVPISVSTSLALLGLAFAIYSWSCFLFVKRIQSWMLLAIIAANLSYCVLSSLILFLQTGITFWGNAYFVGEILIVAGVVLIETSVYRRSFKSTL